MIIQTCQFGKVIRPLLADLVGNLCQTNTTEFLNKKFTSDAEAKTCLLLIVWYMVLVRFLYLLS